MCFGRSGFRRDLAPPKTEDAGLWGAASSVAFGILKADSGLKPLLPNRTMCFGRSGFSRDPCAIEDGRFGIGGGGFIRGLWDLEGRSSGLKPLLPKRTMCFGRSGFSRDPYVIEDGRFGIVGGGFIRGLWDLEGRFGAESPSYQKERCLLVGAALAATLASSKMEGSGLWGAASSVALGILKAGSGLKAPPTKKNDVFVGAALAATLAPSKVEGSELWGTAFIRGLRDLEGRKFGAEPPSARRLGPWIDGFFPKRGRIDAV
jgi:hypothetical protein